MRDREAIAMVRRARVAVCVAVVSIAVLSACGTKSTGDSQGTPPATTPPSPPEASPSTQTSPPAGGTESAPPGAGTKCTAADLEGVIAPSDAAAGNRYADLVVTNTSEAKCTLYGYGGLEFTDADGKPLPTALGRSLPPKPALVTLPPGGKAAKELHWTAVPSGDEPVDGPCETPAAGARVIPPDDTKAFTVTFSFGPVCGHGAVDGSAYFKK
jgi:uncharacterized protein DUF4232